MVSWYAINILEMLEVLFSAAEQSGDGAWLL